MSAHDDRFDRVIDAIYEHGNVVRALREADLSNGKFYRKVEAEPEFAERYARAKAAGLLAVADGMRESLAEKPPMVSTQFGEHVDSGWVQWKRNQADADKWILSKLVPKVYGDKVTLAGDAENPIAIVVSQQSPANYFLSLSVSERQAQLARLSKVEVASLEFNFQYFWARPEQRIPEGDWQVWLALAGRGWVRLA